MTKSTIDGIRLYHVQQAMAVPVGSHAPPRFDLINLDKLSLLIRVLHIFCGLALNPEVIFTRAEGYIPLSLSMVRSPYDSVDKLLDDVPEINHWLQERAMSTERTPDTSPSWAIRLGLTPDYVCAISDAIARQVAKSNTQQVCITAMSGRVATLRIPPVASLVAPMSSKPCGKQQLRIRRKEDYMQAEAITGKRILVSCDAPGATSSARGHLTIDLGRVRKAELMVATDIDLHGKGARE